MRRLAWVAAILLVCAVSSSAAVTEESFPFGRFGRVTVYRASPHPAQVVLFVSGDGGWNLGVVDMARELAGLDATVVGIDITRYLKSLRASSEACSYPAADFEALSKYVQKRLGYPSYVPPVLVGYSSGATLVYATLVEAPATTFRGGLSLGFCPDLPLTKPLCRGSGLDWEPGAKGKGVIFQPAPKLEVPWVALQGTIDQVCDAKATTAYVQQVGKAELVLLPKVGHGFSVPRNWLPQFKQAFARLVEKTAPPATAVADLHDLPLIEVPATEPSGDALAVILTGDGGWGVTDRGVGQELAAHGIPVVALNSLQYYWTPRTPEGAAADLAHVLERYLAAWKKRRAILIGYSFGADVLPFLLNRLPAELRARVRLVALLGPSGSADFEFHLTDWLGDIQHRDSRPTLPEVEKLKGTPLLCFYGSDESDSLCPKLPAGLAHSIEREGGHRLGRAYDPVAEAIRQALQ